MQLNPCQLLSCFLWNTSRKSSKPVPAKHVGAQRVKDCGPLKLKDTRGGRHVGV
jgi:hypothetical protein